MKLKILIVAALVVGTILLVSCTPKTNAPSTTPDEIDLEQKTKTFVDNLLNQKYADCFQEFSEEVKKALSEEKLQQAWEQVAPDTFKEIEKVEKSEQGDLRILIAYCAFEETGITVTIAYDQSNQISGLNFNYYQSSPSPNDNLALPDTLEELAITVGKGTAWELSGKISRQKGQQAPVAVVLVQGSGGSNMDEEIYANKPFRDLAWGLSAQGIDVLRYDKRTFAHAAKLASSDMSKFTVEEETIEDAILAGKLLQEQGYETIYLAGHSLGGMLAPRIEKESNGLFSGLILLAGSPRTLTDIIINQNEGLIATYTDSKQIADSNKILEAEKARLSLLNTWNEDAILQNTVFGMPAYYIRDLNGSDTAAIAKEIKKPILVLQGSADFQVYADKDFSLWKEVLKDNGQAEFILYDGLNHLFMLSEGKKVDTVEEYQTPRQVEQKVIDDIASFIKKN